MALMPVDGPEGRNIGVGVHKIPTAGPLRPRQRVSSGSSRAAAKHPNTSRGRVMPDSGDRWSHWEARCACCVTGDPVRSVDDMGCSLPFVLSRLP